MTTKAKTTKPKKTKHADIVYKYEGDSVLQENKDMCKAHKALLARVNKFTAFLHDSVKEYRVLTHVDTFVISVEVMEPVRLSFIYSLSANGAYQVTTTVEKRIQDDRRYETLHDEALAGMRGIVYGDSRTQAAEFGKVMFDVVQSIGGLQRQLDLDYKRELARLVLPTPMPPTQ